jgi:hypothetical protein
VSPVDGGRERDRFSRAAAWANEQIASLALDLVNRVSVDDADGLVQLARRGASGDSAVRAAIDARCTRDVEFHRAFLSQLKGVDRATWKVWARAAFEKGVIKELPMEADHGPYEAFRTPGGPGRDHAQQGQAVDRASQGLTELDLTGPDVLMAIADEVRRAGDVNPVLVAAFQQMLFDGFEGGVTTVEAGRRAAQRPLKDYEAVAAYIVGLALGFARDRGSEETFREVLQVGLACALKFREYLVDTGHRF